MVPAGCTDGGPRAMSVPEIPGEVGADWALAIVEGLVSGGVRHLCIAPGSRSTALALAACRVPGVTTSVHLDERGAAFYALGYAKAVGAPAAVITTSGTAAANLLPAAVEARLSRTSLVLVTADRPPELRDSGAWQTIDQIKLFGDHVIWFHDLGTPSAAADRLRYAHQIGARAAATAAGPVSGPVHLNVPLREPLVGPRPSSSETAVRTRDGGTCAVWAPRPPPDGVVAELAESIRREPRGLIVAGPMGPRSGLALSLRHLARAAGYPLVADAASNVRFLPVASDEATTESWFAEPEPLVAGAEAFLRDHAWAASHRAEVVLRFGATPIWRPIAEHVGLATAGLTVVDPDATWDDPEHRAAHRILADPVLTAQALTAALGGEAKLAARWAESWCGQWRAADDAAGRMAARAFEQAPAETSLWVVAGILEALPQGASLYAANSMAVREIESFARVAPAGTRVLVNRGAAGIDGTVSAAMGAAAGSRRPTVLLCGDLAFLYDLNALTGAKGLDAPLVLVVSNDRGGGIFAYLDVARQPEFERAFRLHHDVDLASACAAFGVGYSRCTAPRALTEAVRAGLGAPGVTVVEVPVDMAVNTAAHRAYWASVAAQLQPAGG